MEIRWIEADEYGNDNEFPLVAIYRYGEATYYKLQIYQDGEWQNVQPGLQENTDKRATPSRLPKLP